MNKKISLMITLLFALSTILGCQSTSGDGSEKSSIVEKATGNGKLEIADKEYKKAEAPQNETNEGKESGSTLSLDQMRKLAKDYVDNWNGYDNVLRDEWDSGDVRVYEFQDGPTEHIIGVTVNYKTGEVTPDLGMF